MISFFHHADMKNIFQLLSVKIVGDAKSAEGETNDVTPI
jgi:hypothetical protein